MFFHDTLLLLVRNPKLQREQKIVIFLFTQLYKNF
jgi:hypothetical protein